MLSWLKDNLAGCTLTSASQSPPPSSSRSSLGRSTRGSSCCDRPETLFTRVNNLAGDTLHAIRRPTSSPAPLASDPSAILRRGCALLGGAQGPARPARGNDATVASFFGHPGRQPEPTHALAQLRRQLLVGACPGITCRVSAGQIVFIENNSVQRPDFSAPEDSHLDGTACFLSVSSRSFGGSSGWGRSRVAWRALHKECPRRPTRHVRSAVWRDEKRSLYHRTLQFGSKLTHRGPRGTGKLVAQKPTSPSSSSTAVTDRSSLESCTRRTDGRTFQERMRHATGFFLFRFSSRAQL